MDPRTGRIIDANLNRLTEGLKVVEDVLRLGFEARALLAPVRRLRNSLCRPLAALRREVVGFRASETDPGRPDRFDRLRRRDLDDVLRANLKRAQESCRVLEETLKVARPGLAPGLKAARFRLYDIEKLVAASRLDSAGPTATLRRFRPQEQEAACPKKTRKTRR